MEESLTSVEGWRADEILEDKNFFGVNVYDEKTQKQLDDHGRLLANSKRSLEEETKLANLTQELKSKRVVGSRISDIDHQQFQRLSRRLEALKREKENGYESKSNESSS